ncbi:MAG: methyl-accepting chemotaxis protein [Chromatiales bacterium]|nr:methyl-accepting chemotaxis protein [Gammaproteobacteria bacterium]MCP5353050.1 methyl-accepting chemotaxis protein [Chromatiales bacterium]
MFTHRSIVFKFMLLFTVSVLLLGGAFYSVLINVYQNQLRSEARTMANSVDAFSKWVGQFGGVFTRNSADSYLSKAEYFKTGSADTITLYAKNSALSVREFSETVSRSDSHAKFRMVAENPMNPANAADPFEMEALQRFKVGDIKEYDAFEGSEYRYARTITHARGCITCHGDPKDAPESVISRYGKENGFGFREGDVAGVMSVTLPARSMLSIAGDMFGPMQIALIVGAFVFAVLYLRREVLEPVGWITEVADRMSKGNKVDVDLDELEAAKSGNEMLRLTAAILRLRGSLEDATVEYRRRAKQAATAASGS